MYTWVKNLLFKLRQIPFVSAGAFVPGHRQRDDAVLELQQPRGNPEACTEGGIQGCGLHGHCNALWNLQLRTKGYSPAHVG